MRSFFVLFVGQVVSLAGSNLTSFALGVWVYQTTGQVTSYALIFLCTWIPHIFITPFAGVMVDRWNQRTTLLLSDAGASLGTLVVALLFITSRLEIWHIYLITLISSGFGVFQFIALPPAVTLLVPKKHLGRASGVLLAGRAAAQIVAPMLAGVLVTVIGVGGVILIDFSTFLLAVGLLLSIRIPRPAADPQAPAATKSMREEAAFGWVYLWRHPGLLALALFFFTTNFCLGMVHVLITPLVLGFASVAVLGMVLSVGGAGMLSGSLLMSIWGGPRRRILGVMALSAVQGLCLVVGGLRPDVVLVTTATFLVMFSTPLIAGSSNVIWQSKVAPALQGRVFSARHIIASTSQPLAYLLAGPLADNVCEPALAPGGALSASVGRVIGTGMGRGSALLLMGAGVLILGALLGAVSYPPLRRVEQELPDATEDSSVAPGEVPPAGGNRIPETSEIGENP